jgi:hypothetical protein
MTHSDAADAAGRKNLGIDPVTCSLCSGTYCCKNDSCDGETRTIPSSQRKQAPIDELTGYGGW